MIAEAASMRAWASLPQMSSATMRPSAAVDSLKVRAMSARSAENRPPQSFSDFLAMLHL